MTDLVIYNDTNRSFAGNLLDRLSVKVAELIISSHNCEKF